MIEAKREADKNLKFNIYCYTLGKEEVFWNLAEYFKTRVKVEKDRFRKLAAFGMDKSHFVTKQMWDKKDGPAWLAMKTMRDLPKTKEDVDVKKDLVHVVLTGWKGQYNVKHPRYFKVPYSSHSSGSELETFVKALQPNKLIYIVNNSAQKDKKREEFETRLVAKYTKEGKENAKSDPKTKNAQLT